MKTIDKSRLMKRAWYLVKNQGYTLGIAMSKVWKEMKEFIAEKAREAKAEIESAKLKAWWSTDEYKAIEVIENNKYKQFRADK